MSVITKDGNLIVHAGQKILFDKLDARLKDKHGKAFDVAIVAEPFHQARLDALAHHEMHVRELKLNEGSVDVYKTVSWHTWYLAKRLHAPNQHDFTDCVINAGLETLNQFLAWEKEDSKKLGPQVLALICAMVKNELDSITDHGIAKNGLYLSFHCAKEMRIS